MPRRPKIAPGLPGARRERRKSRSSWRPVESAGVVAEWWRGGERVNALRGLFNGALDLMEPIVARPEIPVIPGLEEALLFEATEVVQKVVLPRLVLVAVANENGWSGGHCSLD